MAEKKSGNSQISTQYSGKDAPIKKQGQPAGRNYGMDPNRKQSGGNKAK